MKQTNGQYPSPVDPSHELIPATTHTAAAASDARAEQPNVTASPTLVNYGTLDGAFNYYNQKLFRGQLPRCLITMQRRAHTFGYYSSSRFVSASETQADEIALNPRYFAERSAPEVLSTLVHEMVHLWQHHFGKPSGSTYHNKEWARAMLAIGLIPSDTGQFGGRLIGHHMSHYIAEGGPFDRACKEFIAEGFVIPYCDDVLNSGSGSGVGGKGADAAKRRQDIKSASKSKYSCPRSL